MILFWRLLFFVALAAQLYAAGRFLRRRRRPWSPAEVVALLMVASSAGDLAGPWLRAHPVAAWELGRLPAVATWASVALYQTWCLWASHRSQIPT